MSGTYVIHPKIMEELRRVGRAKELSASLDGCQVMVSEHAMQRPWIFPTERFIEYEESDKAWAIPLRFGRWGEEQPTVFFVSDFSRPFYMRKSPNGPK